MHRRAAAILLLLALLASCKGRHISSSEHAYVGASQAFLRDRLSAVYNKVGTVKNGERVDVLEKSRRFVKVRTAAGLEGWVEEHNLITQDVYDQIQKLATENRNTPAQARGITHKAVNLHVEPSRESEHLYQLAENTKIDLLKRALAEKPGPKPVPVKTSGKKEEEPKPILQDWWLVRDPQGHAGWVLGRQVDVDVPLEIAQYSEGQRIVAFFALNTVNDEDKKVPQYLVLLTDNKDGLPWDYDQIRMFTWNTRRHRYETAYREHNLFGVLPVITGNEDFGKEGVEPVFTLKVKDENGNLIDRKYRLIGPIVRRVTAPGEGPQKLASTKQKTGKRKKGR